MNVLKFIRYEIVRMSTGRRRHYDTKYCKSSCRRVGNFRPADTTTRNIANLRVGDFAPPTQRHEDLAIFVSALRPADTKHC